MSHELRGKRVIVTGALGGIGSQVVARLEARGAAVAGIDKHPGEGVVAGDVSDRDVISSVIDEAADRLGGIDILVNNAGIGGVHDSGDFPDDVARAVIDVNFFGAWNTTAAAMPYLLASKGHVVNVSSGLALVDVPFAAAYSASKRALDAYSNALRMEYAGRLSVTTVHPGYIRTGIHEVPAAAGVTLEGIVHADRVEQAADAIARACVDRPRSMTTSRRSALELWAARRFARATAWVLERRFNKWRATATPTFLRFPLHRSRAAATTEGARK